MYIRKGFESVTLPQLEILAHAIGFDRKKIKYNQFKYHRNHYTTNLECSDNVNRLVECGLMREVSSSSEKQRCFVVTQWGKDLIGNIFNCKVRELD